MHGAGRVLLPGNDRQPAPLQPPRPPQGESSLVPSVESPQARRPVPVLLPPSLWAQPRSVLDRAPQAPPWPLSQRRGRRSPEGCCVSTHPLGHAAEVPRKPTPLTAAFLPSSLQVLIIGGGDGGVLREVVKHPTVESVVQCEIDEVRWAPGCLEMPQGFGQTRQKAAVLHSIHGSCCFTCCPLSAARALAAGSASVTLTAPPLCLTSHLRGSWPPLSCDFFHTRTVEALPGQRGVWRKAALALGRCCFPLSPGAEQSAAPAAGWSLC